MLNYIIKAILNEDGSVAWQVNGNSVPVARLMAHQRAVQRIELATNGFIINDGETVKVSFFNPEKSLKVDEETMFKRDGLQEWFLSVPAFVHNTPGKWEAQFFIVDESGNVMPSQKTVFVEYSSIESAGIEMVTEEQVAELWENANNAKRISEEAKDIAVEKANNAANSASECEEIKREILENKGTKVYYVNLCWNTLYKPAAGALEILDPIPGMEQKEGDIIIDSAVGIVLRAEENFFADEYAPEGYPFTVTVLGYLPKEEVKPAKMYTHIIQLINRDYTGAISFAIKSSRSTAYTNVIDLARNEYYNTQLVPCSISDENTPTILEMINRIYYDDLANEVSISFMGQTDYIDITNRSIMDIVENN